MKAMALSHLSRTMAARSLKLAAISAVIAGASMAIAAPAFAQANGTTLAAYKTIDICKVSDTTWRYSGEVAVWNAGALPTEGLKILDYIQRKASGPTWTTVSGPMDIAGGAVIAPGTTQATATTFSYTFDGPALTGYSIRNVADLTITNHSGHLGTPFGPSPKATYAGPLPPPACSPPCGCTYTRGYWGNKPGVTWPAPYDRSTTFYYSGQAWQQILTAPGAGNGYYILGPQFIAAKLNVANGACLPSGVKTTLDLAEAWFANASNTPATCSTGGSCGLQKDWGAILDKYNNGIYPGGPAHCGDE